MLSERESFSIMGSLRWRALFPFLCYSVGLLAESSQTILIVGVIAVGVRSGAVRYYPVPLTSVSLPVLLPRVLNLLGPKTGGYRTV